MSNDHKPPFILVFALLAMCVLVLTSAISSAITRAFYIDVDRVVIPDHAVGEDPIIKVYREIKGVRDIASLVTIRRANGQYVCHGPKGEPFPYNPDANKVNPLEMKYSYWAWDERAIKPCVASERHGAGEFYAVTCHYGYINAARVSRNCVQSNVYRRTDTK